MACQSRDSVPAPMSRSSLPTMGHFTSDTSERLVASTNIAPQFGGFAIPGFLHNFFELLLRYAGDELAEAKAFVVDEIG